ncbi:MAG TPA: DUF2007 domain-containing protein [Prolixibacteraceae bacterium]|jgi:hypothetical protein
MKKGSSLIRVFTGTEFSVYRLKERLEEVGISALIKDDFQSGLSGGFVSGTPTAIDLYIQESDIEEAEPIINEFIQNDEE